ncbi:MAG TPA: amidohydrolase [Nitrososphaeraceae archaeon]|nr:amidohydrolase [Nitrososphaeraceae archaeon]
MSNQQETITADIILLNGHIATIDNNQLFVSSVAIKNGIFIAVGNNDESLSYKGKDTKVIDLNGRTVVPGLNDSHIHIIRGGLYYNLELRWDGVPSLAEALNRIKEQSQHTPDPHWIRVVGGWSELQFKEKRMSTIEEIESNAGNVPAFILHLYHCAMINKKTIEVAGYNKDTPNPPGAEFDHDENGNLTGLITAKPAATILYQTLAKGPKLLYDEQINSTRQFMYELNRFGVTSAIDAGGGFQNYPDDYKVISDLAKQGLLTVRIAYNLFTQKPKKELEDFTNWIKMVKPGEGNNFYRMNGAGEMLVFSAADWENTLEPRPDLVNEMESELKEVVKVLVQNRWPFRIHATYNESITRFLNVFEEVNKEIPFNGLRWFFDHAETISEDNIQRVKQLGGGIAIQDRLAFQGEYFIDRYGKDVSENSPPIKKIIEMGVPLGAGTDATRVSSYNPWISLYWLVSGKSVGGITLRSKNNCLDRIEALKLYTLGSAWFSGEQDKKGSIEVGKFADLSVLSNDYFSVNDEKIKNIESVLTIVGGQVVYATDEFKDLAPLPLPINPSWSPVAIFGGYYNKNSVNFSSSANNSKTSHKNNHYEKSLVKEETVISNSYLEHQIDTNIELPNSGDVYKNTNKISNIPRSFCPCCDDFFSF